MCHKKTFVVVSLLIAVMALAVIVSPANAGLWVDPNIYDVNIIEGCTLIQNLTIGNDGVEDLSFTLRSRETSREILTRISHNTIEKSSLFWYKSLIEKNLNQKQGANHENTL